MVQTSGGGGLFLLFLVFLVLKLTGVIAWSWWLVTLPLWGGLVLSLSIIGIAFLVVLISGWWTTRRVRKRARSNR
jgi:uncharacterized membrane-anchored protein